MAVGAIALALLQRRFTEQRRVMLLLIGGAGAALGALEFAGSLARENHSAWPGWIGGVVCALIAVMATWPLLSRVRKRLDQAAVSALPAYAEGVALVFAVLSVLAPPVGVIVLLGLLWLLVAGRGREEQKYAGLRILK
jgi:uncharacterized membrane protein YhaH (DUF805 family)